MLRIIDGKLGTGRTRKLAWAFLGHAKKHKAILISHPSQRPQVVEVIAEFYKEHQWPFTAAMKREFESKIITVWELQHIKQGLPAETDLFIDNTERVLQELLRFNVAAVVVET